MNKAQMTKITEQNIDGPHSLLPRPSPYTYGVIRETSQSFSLSRFEIVNLSLPFSSIYILILL